MYSGILHFTRMSLTDWITWTKKKWRDFLIVLTTNEVKSLLHSFSPPPYLYAPMEFHHVNNMGTFYCQWQAAHYIHFICTMSSEVVIYVIAYAWWSKTILTKCVSFFFTYTHIQAWWSFSPEQCLHFLVSYKTVFLVEFYGWIAIKLCSWSYFLIRFSRNFHFEYEKLDFCFSWKIRINRWQC